MTPTPSEILDRLPQQNLEAERQVLGSILLLPAVLDDLTLTESEFYAEANRIIYRHMRAMHRERSPIDALLLRDRLQQAADWERIGENAYLLEIIHSVVHASHAQHYAAIVRRTHQLRTITHAATETLRDAWQSDADPIEVLERTEKALSQIVTHDGDKALVDAQGAAERVMDLIDAVMSRARQMGIMTGLEEFDRLYGGLFPSELIIVAARLGVGKTSLACQWAASIASRHRLTYFASLEMDALELATRMICSRAGVTATKLRNASLGPEDQTKLVTAGNEFAQHKLLIDERTRLKVSDILRTTRRLVRDDLELIVVDYAQKIKPDNSHEAREQQVAQIARDLKDVARELNVPVVVLAQLNRNKSAIDGTGGAEDLRESDVLGQEADMVIRIDYKQPTGDKPAEYWLRLVKNRNGPVGKLQLDFDAAVTRFDVHRVPAEQQANYERGFAEYDGRNEDW